MQAPAKRVNIAAPSGRALSVLRLRGPGGPTLAIIAVGLAVTAAHRLEDLVADRRPERAGARLVGTAAAAGFELAELAATAALEAGEAATRPAEAGRIGAARERDQQGQRRKPDEKRCLHERPPDGFPGRFAVCCALWQPKITVA